jgi:hypothetical protein
MANASGVSGSALSFRGHILGSIQTRCLGNIRDFRLWPGTDVAAVILPSFSRIQSETASRIADSNCDRQPCISRRSHRCDRICCDDGRVSWERGIGDSSRSRTRACYSRSQQTPLAIASMRRADRLRGVASKSVIFRLALQIFANDLAAQGSVADIVFGGQSLQPFKVRYFWWDCNRACCASKCYPALPARVRSFVSHALHPLTPSWGK